MDKQRRLHSIRLRVTLLTLAAIAITATLIGAAGVLAVMAPGQIMGARWRTLAVVIAGLTLLLLAVFAVVVYAFMGRITDPLNRLTAAVRQLAEGDFDVSFSCDEDGEIGALAEAFRMLIARLKVVISDLNGQLNRDALTGVRNKGGFDGYARKLNESIQSSGAEATKAFAAVMFDCNELKEINDACGHDKGDIYLQNACRLICRTFAHSPVFRLGGDEFVAILINEDLQNRDALLARFDADAESINAAVQNPWDRICIARGVALYDSGADPDVETVLKRADAMMYEEKRKYKAEHGGRQAD